MSEHHTDSRSDHWPPPSAGAIAVLVSGGLDSAVLLGEALRSYAVVQPLYVRTGLFWEGVERTYLDRYLAAIRAPNLRTLHVLELPVADVYGDHWSLSGRGVPGADTDDDAVFLPGRNVMLLAKALLWCHLNGVPELATAPLSANPFPDATPQFYDGFAQIVSEAIGGRVRVLRPYAHLTKELVVTRGRDLPLGETFSCLRPVSGRHCGRCNKCFERQQGFRAAGRPDPTTYAE